MDLAQKAYVCTTFFFFRMYVRVPTTDSTGLSRVIYEHQHRQHDVTNLTQQRHSKQIQIKPESKTQGGYRDQRHLSKVAVPDAPPLLPSPPLPFNTNFDVAASNSTHSARAGFIQSCHQRKSYPASRPNPSLFPFVSLYSLIF